jgi:hypothetical protein
MPNDLGGVVREPELPVEDRPASVSNAPVPCRSAVFGLERQLPHPTKWNYRPKRDVRASN